MAVLAGVVAAMSPPRPGITKENGWRIKEGMTKAEVESILGGPPKPSAPGKPAYEKSGNGAEGVWLHYGLGVWVAFDSRDQVTHRSCYGLQRRPWWDRLRDVLPW
jgi:hypothetical protein